MEVRSLAKAKEQNKRRIAELCQGDKSDRRLASELTKCRKGSRCNLMQCEVCEYQKKKAMRKVPARLVKSILGLRPIEVSLDDIQVPGRRRTVNSDTVRVIAASLKLIGLLVPISVRKQKNKVVLVAGHHRLLAAKRAGWTTIPCDVLRGTKEEQEVWMHAENFCRADLTVLDRAESLEALRDCVRRMQVGQVALPGGKQPADIGINKTAKLLGLTKEDVRRCRAIAAIAPALKKRLRKEKLDDHQGILLEIAEQPTKKEAIASAQRDHKTRIQ